MSTSTQAKGFVSSVGAPPQRESGVNCAGNATMKEDAATRELRMSRRSDLRLGAVDLRVTARRIEIRNPAVIPDEVKYQIFNRSFSTKGAGRGIGTYSVKLLTEHYLEGEVGFSTEPGSGTAFHVLLPTEA